MRRCRFAALVCCATAVAATSCGVPSSPSPIQVSRVPYDLLSPSPTASSVPTSPAVSGPYVYFLEGDRLVPFEADLEADGLPADTVASILSRLVDGPSEQERRNGLSSAFGPGVAISLRGLESGRAEIAVETGSPGPSAAQLPLAVGQVVLSVTSVAGVSSVVLLDDAGRIDAPLPGGARTDRPLTAADYDVLVRSGTG